MRPGDHLVGQSYGGVIALLAAPRLPLASLTVIEPPAFGVARGDPAVERWLERASALPRDDLRTYVEAFLAHVGAPLRLPDPLPPALNRVPGVPDGAVALGSSDPARASPLPRARRHRRPRAGVRGGRRRARA